jgi:4'-phosphopantetheinyl transferase
LNPTPRSLIEVQQRVYGEAQPPLEAEAVDLWLLPLIQSAADHRALSPEEQARAGRFRFERDRTRWIAARAMLRSLLAGYIGQSALTLRFASTEYGKPFLLDFPGISFNLSHAGDYGLLAVTRARAVGVDIERIRPDFADPAVARHFFSSAEQAQLAQVPPDQYTTAFFTCWVRKESYIKARGEGLSHPLKDFDVSVQPDAAACLLATRPDAVEKAHWQMGTVAVPAGYLAALTVELHFRVCLLSNTSRATLPRPR